MRGRGSSRSLWSAFLLFVMTGVTILSLARAALVLWWFEDVRAAGAIPGVFVAGLRFDIAVVGLLLLPAMPLALLAALHDGWRDTARRLLYGWLAIAMTALLTAELLTPPSLDAVGLRPDASLLAHPAALLSRVGQTMTLRPVPTGIALLLVAMILVGFLRRLAALRPLRRPLPLVTGVTGLVLCTAIARIALVQRLDPVAGPIGPDVAEVSEDPSVNDLSVNGLYHLLHFADGRTAPAEKATALSYASPRQPGSSVDVSIRSMR